MQVLSTYTNYHLTAGRLAFSNQEVGTSPFFICDFTLLLNTAGSSQVQSVLLHWDRNNLVHWAFLVGGCRPNEEQNIKFGSKYIKIANLGNQHLHVLGWSGSSSFFIPWWTCSFFAMKNGLPLVGCFIMSRYGWTGPFCCVAFYLEDFLKSFWCYCLGLPFWFAINFALHHFSWICFYRRLMEKVKQTCSYI